MMILRNHLDQKQKEFCVHLQKQTAILIHYSTQVLCCHGQRDIHNITYKIKTEMNSFGYQLEKRDDHWEGNLTLHYIRREELMTVTAVTVTGIHLNYNNNNCCQINYIWTKNKLCTYKIWRKWTQSDLQHVLTFTNAFHYFFFKSTFIIIPPFFL